MKHVLKVLVFSNSLFFSSVIASEEDFQARLVSNDQYSGFEAGSSDQNSAQVVSINHRRPHPVGFAGAPATPGATAAQLAGAAAVGALTAAAAAVSGQQGQPASLNDLASAFRILSARVTKLEGSQKNTQRLDGFDLFARDSSRFLLGVVVGVVAAPAIRSAILHVLLKQGNR